MKADDDDNNDNDDSTPQGRRSSEDDTAPDRGAPGENTLGRKFAWPEFAWPEALERSPDVIGFGEKTTTLERNEQQIRQPAPPAPSSGGGERYLGEFAQDRRYRGLRRADRVADRHWPVIGAALAAVSVALAVLIVVASMPVRRGATVPPNGMGAPGVSVGANPQPTAPTIGPASTVPAMGNPVPTRKAVPNPNRKNGQGLNGQGVTYEAEAAANVLSGSAFVTDYARASGGRIVRNIGEWDDPNGPGTLTFTQVSVPANGVYTLRFFYVHIDNQQSRTVYITIATVGSFAVTVNGSSTCCASKAVAIPLQKGINPITFANPDGPAPSIDKIVISSL
ncbi:MAG TPA: hypothetical protein VJT31_21125 [Rugosimonospora sp.]|nr:hypothetical protein [Rugosimonospora sp.]